MLRLITNMKISTLLVVTILILVSVPLGAHYFLSKVNSETNENFNLDSMDPEAARSKLRLLNFEELSGDQLRQRLDDLLRIKHSVLTELRYIEQDRAEKLRQKSEMDRLINNLKSEANRNQADLDRLRLSISQAKHLLKELSDRNNPKVLPPLQILSSLDNNYEGVAPRSEHPCTMGNCFDWARCPLSSGFPVYFYSTDSWVSDGGGFGYFSTDPARACLYVAALNFSSRQDLSKELKFWRGDGRNHLLVDVESFFESGRVLDLSVKNDYGRAMIATTRFAGDRPRPRFDHILPLFSSRVASESLWNELPDLLPLRRKFLFSFEGKIFAEKKASATVDKIKSTLAEINADETDDKVHLNFDCFGSFQSLSLCGSDDNRSQILSESTFALIFVGRANSLADVNRRLYEALRAAAVPVLLCFYDCAEAFQWLPFSEYVDYQRILVATSIERITELHFLLRSVPDKDLFHMKRQGRLIWQNYLGSSHSVMASILNVVRQRIGLPAAPAKDEPSWSAFPPDFKPLTTDQLLPESEPAESLGPLEGPVPSEVFQRNFSAFIVNGYESWNEHFTAFNNFPFTPWEPVLPTDAKFLGSPTGFRPIGDGEGGAGYEFSHAIGGNVPHEQFTVVMLTYKRDLVLIDSIGRLYGLPYLNKVIVVWNSPDPPADDLKWPEIGAPIEVIRTSQNSLNNRFLPFDAIETEAVLSVDDDAQLRHDEIIFGFRVWRENRNRLVGFPGRYHAWDSEHTAWKYNSQYSCELSMVLTGAAFFHKFYSYAYTALMPAAIRDKVDELMNCEDLAMNFLISHLTRQPPVKVTSRWTFRCPGCPMALSEDDSHYNERHDCINFFIKVYGYNPLMYTQYRADSVLFKTRIAQDKQKCFKFV